MQVNITWDFGRAENLIFTSRFSLLFYHRGVSEDKSKTDLIGSVPQLHG
jgi:hypothetical protein